MRTALRSCLLLAALIAAGTGAYIALKPDREATRQDGESQPASEPNEAEMKSKTVFSLPGDAITTSDSAEYLGHYFVHAVLASLIYLIVRPRTSLLSQRIRAAAIAVGASIAVAVVVESVQVFLPERSVEVADLLFGAAGAATGAWAVFILNRVSVTRLLLSLPPVPAVGTIVM